MADLTSQLDTANASLASTKGTLSAAHSTMEAMLSKTVITQGYDSQLTITAIINDHGQIAHLKVDASGETEGAKTMDPAYLVQFLGKSLPLTLGTDVDAVAGATVTSQAIVDALNRLLPETNNGYDESTVINQRSKPNQKTYVVTGEGHSSTVVVTVTVNQDGTIVSMDVNADGETMGSMLDDASFCKQFVGKEPPLTLGDDVDAVSGATATSQAVVDALNKLPD